MRGSEACPKPGPRSRPSPFASPTAGATISALTKLPPVKEPEQLSEEPADTAPVGHDTHKIESLLDNSIRHGTAVLGSIAGAALTRLVNERGVHAVARAQRFFSDDERKQLAEVLAATNGTAHLLGRARVRLRMEQARKHYEQHTEDIERFSDRATDFTCFDEPGIKPLLPERAVEFFRRLIPRLGVDPGRFGASQRRQAFTLAQATEQTVLEAVKDAASRLESGEASTGTQAIQAILDAAGLTPRNPQYAEMVWRTNVKDAYAEGADEERQDPEVADFFPVWRYVGIRDGRQRSQHEAHFDRYFANDVRFAEVRDSLYGGKFSGYNCRCDQVPIDKYEWARQLARGATLTRLAA